MDELNVIFRNTHGNYYYGEGLCYVLQNIFPDKVIRFHTVSDLRHEDADGADIVILDLCRGEELLCHRALYDCHPALLIGLTEDEYQPEKQTLPLCLRRMSFICKNDSPENMAQQIGEALVTTLKNEKENTPVYADICTYYRLSVQQDKVTEAFCQGMTIHQISRKLSLDRKTVYTHKERVCRRFNLRTCSSLDLLLLRRQMEKISRSAVTGQEPCLFDAD